MEEVKIKKPISISEVKEILEKEDPESMDQIQRWTYDYVSKFVKIDPKNARMKRKPKTPQVGMDGLDMQPPAVDVE